MRLTKLEIQGFRSFGPGPQVIEFDGEFAVIYAANSQGKTSLAEAVEFLLTGTTSRRRIVSSAVREFRGSLRNAHLTAEHVVYVKGTFRDQDNVLRTLERRLTRDCTGRADCENELLVDGAVGQDVSAIGIRLAAPPIAAPVLMQHTIRHVVSAGPENRAAYFRALLDVADVYAVQQAIAAAAESVPLPTGPLEDAYVACLEDDAISPPLEDLFSGGPTEDRVRTAVSAGLALFIEGAGGDLPEGLTQRTTAARRIVDDVRRRVFPLAGFDRRAEARWTALEPDFQASTREYFTARDDTDREAVAASGLLSELMKLRYVAEAAAPVDCPACLTEQALTPHRVAEVRESLRTTETYRGARARAATAISEARRWVRQVTSALDQFVPQFMRWTDEERARQGFDTASAADLLGAPDDPLLQGWDARCAPLQALYAQLVEVTDEVADTLAELSVDDIDEATAQRVGEALATIEDGAARLAGGLNDYDPGARALRLGLASAIDRQGDTAVASALLMLAADIPAALAAAQAKYAAQTVLADVSEARASVDSAYREILDEKYDALSSEISRWWELLRPDEPTSFSRVNRVGEGNRFIDLCARLHAEGPPPRDEERSAAAVLSDSQLNCLGLAAFLARSVRDGPGFVLLDDPVPASDDEHRLLFVRRVLPAMVDAGIHVIVTTHNDALRRDIQVTLGHRTFDTMIATIASPEAGTRVESRGGDFAALRASARQWMRSADDDVREIAATRLRKAAERLCKTILVRQRQAGGEPNASVTDYQGRQGTLGHMVPLVLPYITDPAHVGLFRGIPIRLNRGAHDDTCPPVADTVCAYGELGVLGDAYL